MSYRPVPEQYKGRMFPKVWDRELLQVWTEPDLYATQIQALAVSLPRDQLLEYYNLDEYDLPDYDYWFFDANFKQGRANAAHLATTALFKNMNGSPQAVIAYLDRFGKGEWLNNKGNPETNIKSIKLVLDDGTSLT